MDIVNLIISLLSGAAGGNVAGAAMPDKSLGALGNTIAGLIGGGGGLFLLKALGVIASTAATGGEGAPAAFDLTSIISSIVGGGVGGGVLTAIVALIKSAVEKK